MEKLPVIYLTIDDDHETGLEAISLVDHPAIERNWMTFNKGKQMKFALNEEKKIVSGICMTADYPIYRKDEDGREYYVVFDSDSIRKIAYKFMKEGKTSATNHRMALGLFLIKLTTIRFGLMLKLESSRASQLRAYSASPGRWTLTK